MEMVCSPLSPTLPSLVVHHQASTATATESGGFCSRKKYPKTRDSNDALPEADYDGEIIVLSKVEVCSSRHVFRESVLVNLGQKITFYFMDLG